MPPLDENSARSLKITVNYKDEEGNVDYISGVAAEIYQVAGLTVWQGSANYILTEAYRDTGFDVEGITASESNEVAKMLAEKVQTDGLKGMSGITDENGQISYQDLNPGIYLVRQTGRENQHYAEMEPFLVMVPLPELSEDGNTWIYQVEVFPKMEISKEDGPEEGVGGKIQVTKKMEFFNNSKRYILSAKDARYYVRLFMDPAGTRPYEGDGVKEIRIIEGISGDAVFEDLPNGTYYVFETDPEGNAYLPDSLVETEQESFHCEYGTDQKVEIDLGENKTLGNVEIHNVYVNFPEGYQVRATISVTKYVLDLNGEKTTVDDIFYAGAFRQNGNSYELVNMVELKQNDVVTMEVSLSREDVFNGVSYWVFETDAQGNRVNEKKFGYKIDGETSLNFSLEELGKDIVLTNNIIEMEAADAPSEAPENAAPSGGTSGGGHGGGSSSSQIIKTGDDTAILEFVLLLLAMLPIIIGVLIKKRRG